MNHAPNTSLRYANVDLILIEVLIYFVAMVYLLHIHLIMCSIRTFVHVYLYMHITYLRYMYILSVYIGYLSCMQTKIQMQRCFQWKTDSLLDLENFCIIMDSMSCNDNVCCV